MLSVVNPATEEVIRKLETDDAAAIDRKAAAARLAQRDWALVPLAERLDVIRRFGTLLRERKEELAATLTSEMGKPIRQSRNELAAMQGRIDFFLANTEQAISDEIVQRPGNGAEHEERISYEPLGIVANISAWNYPYFVGSNVFVPALLTGNAVLYKASEYAALTGLAIARLLHDAGVPADVFATVIGAGDTGTALLAADIDAVAFTGSFATGRRVAQAAAERLLRVQLELGGKDPAYVADDVDPRAAAEAVADGAFYNAGQSCCAVERVYVQAGIAADFIAAFVDTVRGFKVGNPAIEDTYIGPLARKAQLDVLEAQVADATALGARVVTGGKRRAGRGWYFEPTVLTGVDQRMKIMRDESFGPVIGIQEVADDAEAARLMNDTDYGLTAAVYTKDRERAESLLERIDAGTVYWNCCDRVSPRLPWSGRRHSGIGSTLSIAGIRTFVQPKAWHLKLRT